MVVIGKVVLLEQKWLNYGKSGCIQAKLFYSGKSVFFSGKSGCIPAKWLYSDKSGCNRTKVVVFGQKWMYSGKEVIIG